MACRGLVGESTKVALVGSRNINDMDFVERQFFWVLRKEGVDVDDVVIVSGGATGVDTLAQRIARKYGLTIVIHYPQWWRFGKAAGPMRNAKIVKDADVVLAIRTAVSKGTDDLIRKAHIAGKKVYEVLYELKE